MVNFWATWCAPCREEIPDWSTFRPKYGPNGVEIVGIAIDSADKVRDFVKIFGIAYPVLVGGMETIDLMRTLGNKAGGLPLPSSLDRDGRVVAAHLGLMSVEQVEAAIRCSRRLSPRFRQAFLAFQWTISAICGKLAVYAKKTMAVRQAARTSSSAASSSCTART